jgi:hypothetical protein
MLKLWLLRNRIMLVSVVPPSAHAARLIYSARTLISLARCEKKTKLRSIRLLERSDLPSTGSPLPFKLGNNLPLPLA